VLQLKGLKVPAVGKKVTLLGGMILGEFEGQLGGRAWVARARPYAEAAAGGVLPTTPATISYWYS
jgi:hypothetical protein